MKELISWNEQYSVGIKKFDDEHKVILNLINQLHSAMRSGKTEELLNLTIKRLVDYASTHFQAEEKLFDLHNYLKKESHKKEHAFFISKIQSFRQKNDTGKNSSVSIELIGFLREWLLKHILSVDKQYTDFMHEKGVK